MRKNITLIIGFAIPFALLLFVIIMTYFPSKLIAPQYDFLYVTGGNYYYPARYNVIDHRLTFNEQALPANQPKPKEQLYWFHVKKNQAEVISFQEAQNLLLDSAPISPDGFTITYGAKSNFVFPLFLFNTDVNAYLYLQKGSFSKRLNVIRSKNYYNNFHFLGWIINGKT
ncbi:MAG: hypothetical protein AB7F64_06010 [Gammaproteobacteria bacterium]